MKKIARLLVVDDETNARSALAELLRDEGYSVETAADGFKALGKIKTFIPDILVTDLKMPGLDGLELMEKVTQTKPETPVIVMTAFGAVDTAVSAIRLGAVDYLTKPFKFEDLLKVIRRALILRNARNFETSHAKDSKSTQVEYSNMKIIGKSEALQPVFRTIQQVSPSRATILITGESGTGKELVAAAIHKNSPRADFPFVKLHCASLAETLLESELFGHERGAFTGALQRREGRFFTAHRGTLFLDEISEISPSIQVKLLRFLQEREFERVGGTETISVDIRIIAATNHDLLQLVKNKTFREDLYYRLNVVNIAVPSLRSRKSDIPLLANHFVEKYALQNDKSLPPITPEVAEVLIQHDWPGNVRELENIIERAVIMCHGSTIKIAHLPENLKKNVPKATLPEIPGSSLEEIERFAILKTLESMNGSTSKAAKILGISSRKIQYKLHQYGEAPKSGIEAVDDEY